MIVLNDLFDYGYKIYQNPEYFKFSVDSILLAEFVTLKNNIRLLDMCTGNAPIPMILSNRKTNITIDGVEIQREVYSLAKKSIEINKITNINIYNCDINKFESPYKYDIITCNPPYFKVGEKSLLNSNPIKNIARHEELLTLEEVIKNATRLIKENGTLYLIHRAKRSIEIINLLQQYKYGIRRICFISTGNNDNLELVLIEASKCKKSDPVISYLNIKSLNTYQNIFERM